MLPVRKETLLVLSDPPTVVEQSHLSLQVPKSSVEVVESSLPTLLRVQ